MVHPLRNIEDRRWALENRHPRLLILNPRAALLIAFLLTAPALSAAAQPAPTLDPTAQAEVLQAYQHYWEESTLALRDLDPALLDGVAVGKELSGLTSYIDDLHSQGRAIRTHVFHHIYVLSVTPQEAVITDEYEDRSIYIDAITKEPLDPSVPEPQRGPIVKVRKLLQKVDGIWKVAGGQLYE